MDNIYYGPDASAVRKINELLSIKATSREQDWELEFADFGAIDKMLNLLESHPLDAEARTALSLLIISSFELGFDEGLVDDYSLLRASELLKNDLNVLEKMRFYWLNLGRSNFPELMKKLLC
ncbi:hypothetical protein [Paracidovorax cattleyae]|uniref:hypothetical protein n=1 Tax=Paracidovorax cattleyae TaxID=80868 RepID=UPI00115FFB53|nr:hypothetical protein [Paracidovorax cattleyae]